MDSGACLDETGVLLWRMNQVCKDQEMASLHEAGKSSVEVHAGVHSARSEVAGGRCRACGKWPPPHMDHGSGITVTLAWREGHWTV